MTEMQLRQEVSIPVQLAASVLFGDEFLEAADERFLRFIQEDPARWGRLMLATWSTIADAGISPAPREPARDRPTQAAPPARSASPAPTAAPTEAPAEAPAVPAAPQPTAAAGPTQPPAHVGTDPEDTAPAATAAPAGTLPRPIAEPATPTPGAPAHAGGSIDFFDPDEDESAPVGTRPASVEEIKARLVELVAEVSGYPPEIFEDHLDLEVDLGIDSIKQVQTLAKLREEYGLPMDDDFLMKDYATIGKIADYIAARLEAEA
nr:type I PKS [Streptomyces sp.]